MKDILRAALKYQDIGFSIIPVQKNKKPYISWEKYQKEKAETGLIKEWWNHYPIANVAIVTGEISGLNVVDIDTQKGLDVLNEMLPDSFVTPTARTPRGGWHYYCLSQNGLGNATGFIKDCDFRGQGGFIIAPPSIGENGKAYTWLPNLNIAGTPLASVPDPVIKILKSYTEKSQQSGIINVGFEKGIRDDTLFHTALNLLKGHMPIEEVNKVILSLAKTCQPPFPPKEGLIKVQSALKRLEKGDRNLTEEIRGWIEISQGEFYTRDIFEELNIAPNKKSTVSTILTRLASEGLIERTGRRTGCFRRIEKDLMKMDIFSASQETVNIKWPFGIDKMVKTRDGEVIVIAGAKNSGKQLLAYGLQ